MSNKYKYFAFLVYADSAPENWRQLLKDTHFAFAISPQHNADEEHGKPHWHVIMNYVNVVRLEVAQSVIPSGIMANEQLVPVRCPRNYQRYLLHLDDPEKEQFPEGQKAIEILNGFPLDLTRDYSPSELREFRSRIFQLCRDLNLTEYADLLEYLHDTDFELFDYAFNHTIAFNSYLASRRAKAESDTSFL